MEITGPKRLPMPDPTEADLRDPVFNIIWDVIKSWDVNVPAYYEGYSGASGSHVMLILNALRAFPPRPCIHDIAMEWAGACKAHRLNDCRTCEEKKL
jgi:hypothetical protein